jgi:AAA+ ATPase superfamily predicted ATPase
VDTVIEEIKREFNSFLGKAFEEIAREFLSGNIRPGSGGTRMSRVDIVGIRKDEVAFLK